MSELEQAISAREKSLKILTWVVICSVLVILTLGYSTYENFDGLYARKLSVYPTLSAIATLPNVFTLTCLSLLIVGAGAKVKRASESVALKAYTLLISEGFIAYRQEYQPMVNHFLHAAGLPADYSFTRLAKVKTHHFVKTSWPISRSVVLRRAQWVALSRKVS
ncbi:hypothetical protein [Alteromonas lipotrueiana]|uniref:hypothetical protein n=1 Tax=Alteromonas lipotrueiana TaxID=2803815 RepID=UPI001C43D469|nr:hypothetical protein [Alteromonas lipotrueiana]|tara:strand:- start:349 stop:840 length:492 start_codon:yes stop_codon:yes gene_type:complete